MKQIPEGGLVEIKMTVRVPLECSEKDLDAWLRFSLGANGSIERDNPLLSHEPEPFHGAIDFGWVYTNMVGRVEEFDHETLSDGGMQFKVRHIREHVS